MFPRPRPRTATRPGCVGWVEHRETHRSAREPERLRGFRHTRLGKCPNRYEKLASSALAVPVKAGTHGSAASNLPRAYNTLATITGSCGGNDRPRLSAGEAEWIGCRRIPCPSSALNPYTPRTVSAISQSTTAASASDWVAPSASAWSKTASWRWALVPRARIARACSTSSTQPK